MGHEVKGVDSPRVRKTVKRQANAVFTAAFADKKLRESLPNGAKVKCSSVLNFAFMGNPWGWQDHGGSHFRFNLGGRRREIGPQVRGDESVSISQVRALDLASLTGGDLNVGPPPKIYSKGHRSSTMSEVLT